LVLNLVLWLVVQINLTQSALRDDILDTGWLLFAAILVFCMQAGFLCLETGKVRSKNSINVAAKNLSV
tara:strand:+ start:1839 stop:2042 length:204 start_codon:yes stop_codon:yes gene_type:complete